MPQGRSTPPAPVQPSPGRTPETLQSTAPRLAPQETHPDPNSLPEEKPPVGSNLTFSTPQIRYCIYESVRMDGMSSALNTRSQFEVDTFNARVADYNSRCASFRYRRGALEPVQTEAFGNRLRLEQQGVRTFLRSVGRL